MTLVIHRESHVDHGLTEEHLAWLRERFADREAFFIESVELPDNLPSLECGLHGPLMGDEPVEESEVTYAKRGERDWTSRLVAREPRPTRVVSVIAGPHDGLPCVLFTAFGGPVSPQEPGDPGCKDREASEKFWREHALSAG